MIRYLLIVGTLFFWVACNDDQPQVNTVQPAPLPPQYYYYPRANVYFDSANKDYLFLSTDSTNWLSAKQIPAVVHQLMDKGVHLQNPPDPVWKDNATHRLVYSAVLYATHNDTVAKKVVKPARKPVVPVADSVDTIAKKERKGLGKFLDKIFGRNKKKKEGADSSKQE